MPPNFFQKPETALKRAQELISVGKEVDALETLHDTIKVHIRSVQQQSLLMWFHKEFDGMSSLANDVFHLRHRMLTVVNSMHQLSK